FVFFFFFSSRRRHTRCLSDWSSDVCSSDLDIHFLGLDMDITGCSLRAAPRLMDHDARIRKRVTLALGTGGQQHGPHAGGLPDTRSEERRVGKECRSEMSPNT